MSHVRDTTALGRDGQPASAISAHWDTTASTLQRKMRDGSLEFTSYREVLISKGAHSRPRVVSIPTARDRVAIKALAGVIADLFPDSRTPMAQVRVSELVAELGLRKYDSFVRVDVKDFYPSIDHRAIRTKLRSRVRQSQLLTLVMRAISTPTVSLKSAKPIHSNLYGVPQGLSISNLLAEVAMLDVDGAFTRRSGISYFRYVDDILVLCSSTETQAIFDELKKSCAGIGLAVHEIHEGSKSQLGALSESFEYLGYKFHPGGVSVREQSVRKLENTIAHLFTAYKYQVALNSSDEWLRKATEALVRRLDLVIAGCVFDQIPRGWLQYFSQMDDMTLLSRLDAFVLRMARRFDVPPSFRSKSFVRAYWHIAKPNATTRKYIPDFGRFNDVDQREFLVALFPSQNFRHLTEIELEKRFKAEVRRLVSMLERDVSETS